MRVKVMQDGANFYVGDSVVNAPITVKDFDLSAAQAARSWFIHTYCPVVGWEPVFD